MRLFAFGFGYCAQALAARLVAQGWTAAGTARDESKLDALREQGYEAALFSGEAPGAAVDRLLQGTTHLLHSIPPDARGDHVLAHYRDALARLGTLQWVGYLSTVGVYGDQQGRWVDEDTPPKPNSTRTEARVAAEQAWLDFGAATGVPVQIFRLAGIYGPGRSVFDKLKAGTRGGSTSRGRCSAAFMWTTSPPCWRPRSRGRARERFTMSLTTNRRRRAMSWPTRPG